MGGLTVTPAVQHERNPFIGMFHNRNGKMQVGSFAFTGTYVTNGEDIDGKLGFTPVFFIAEPNGGYIFQYDHTNNKLEAYYADYDAGADGALIEVANGADLTGLSDVRYIAIGWK